MIDGGLAGACEDFCDMLNHVAHFALTERVHDDEHLLIVGSPDGSPLALSESPVPEGPVDLFAYAVR